jgi:hypothetical protein
MKYQNLPEDIQREINNLAEQFPLTLEEVTSLYLMGGGHVDYLCQLKSMNIPDIYIQFENQRLWNEENKAVALMIEQGEG